MQRVLTPLSCQLPGTAAACRATSDAEQKSDAEGPTVRRGGQRGDGAGSTSCPTVRRGGNRKDSASSASEAIGRKLPRPPRKSVLLY